jgi:hypothetical protein
MRRKGVILLLLLLGVATCLDLTVTGFLEVPERSVKNFDWKAIEIFIINEDNKIEEKAHPSDNGFYLIPISHKKDYRLMIRSTKKDLQFNPSYFPIKLKNMDEDEALKKYNSASFNFKLSGFSLIQSIRFQGEKPGQSSAFPEKQDVNIQLFQNKKLISSTKTDEHGDFEFKDISPGTYEVKVDEAYTKKVKFASSSFTCTYSWESGSNCDGEIVIGGTKLTRKITLSGEPVRRGTFLIRSLDGADLSHCKEDSKRQGLTVPGGFTCATRISNSYASFNDMPFGKYAVRLFFDNEYIKIEPLEMKVVHPSEEGEQEVLNFIGYSQGQQGKIITPKGSGIGGVEIKVDGEKKYVTNENGYFVMDKLKLGSYEIEATHPHYSFKPFTLKIDGEGEKVLEKIVADKIHLCGKVDFLQKGNESPGSFIVNVQIEGAEGRDKRNTRANPDGTYCYEAPPGVYIVRATINQHDKILSVVPKQRTVTLDNEPALGVDFSREKLSIKGSVEYLPGVPESFTSKTEVGLLNSENQLIKTIKLDKETTFEFNDLFEEGYSVKIINPKLCFEKEVLGGDQSANGAKFVNKGVIVSYKTDVPFKAKVDGSHEVTFMPKKTTLCFSKIGRASIAIDDIFTFKNGMNKFEYDTTKENNKPMVFEVDKIKLKGSIVIDSTTMDSKVEGLTSKLTSAGAIQILSALADGSESVTEVRKISDTKYEYILDTKLNADMTVSPRFNSPELSQRLVVSPKNIRLNIGEHSDSIDNLKPFKVSLGRLIKGRLTKDLKNLKVKILRRSNQHDSYRTFQKLTISTKDFTLGPFEGSFDYDIKLSKKGFDFKVDKSKEKSGDILFDISIIEISQIIVKIATDKKEPLGGVQVYISSTERGNQYKTSISTGPKGSFTRNIHRGEYFVKSVLKEYEFDPPQSVIRIEEGQKKELVIKAKRTQFSVSGTIKSFGGYSVGDLRVEATCEDKDNQLVESSVTDNYGNYLIKGLIPGKTYIVRVNNKNNVILMPEHIKINVTPKDTKGVS